MRLFYINEQYEVELNKEWILLVPEFGELVRRDKGSKGDYRGDKKLKAKRELAFLYFMLDFTSPIREWDLFDRRKEAIAYTGLTEDEVDDPVLTAAGTKYQQLLEQSSRSIKTLNALRRGMDTLDKYFQEVDFQKVDKQGKAFYSPESYIANITKLPKMRAAIKEYEAAVEEELKADTGIRGKATLGGKEGKKAKEVWAEGRAPAGDLDSLDADLIDIDGLLKEEDEP